MLLRYPMARLKADGIAWSRPGQLGHVMDAKSCDDLPESCTLFRLSKRQHIAKFTLELLNK